MLPTQFRIYLQNKSNKIVINKPKLALFIIATILFILTLTLPKVNYLLLIIMYIGLILVGLYDLGKDEPDIK